MKTSGANCNRKHPGKGALKYKIRGNINTVFQTLYLHIAGTVYPADKGTSVLYNIFCQYAIDFMHHFTIPGVTPSKKNSRSIFVKNGVLFNFPGKVYKAWVGGAIESLQMQKMASPGLFPLEKAQCAVVEIYAPNKRTFDLDNRLGSVMDVLTESGIIADDKYEIVPEITIKFGGIDKENPRAEIYITEIS